MKKKKKKNECKFFNQSGEVMYASIYLTNCRKSFFFGSLFKVYVIANIVRLNLAVPKLSETSQEHTNGGVLF